MQLRLLRQASVAKRFRLVRALSQTVATLSRQAIARAHPSLSEHEADILFLRLHYGKQVANLVDSLQGQRA